MDNRLHIGGNGNAQPPDTRGELALKITPAGSGWAVNVRPSVPQGELAEVLHQVTGALVSSEYVLVSAFVSTLQNKESIIRVSHGGSINRAATAALLRTLANGIEAGNIL